jgi:hypothetical protein
MEPSLIPNGPAVQDRAGAGSLMIDGKKMFGIKHWLELTAERARSEVLVALRDNPFSLGPWGETLSQLKPLFLKSTVNLASIPQSAASLVALDGESTISLDWTLPLMNVARKCCSREFAFTMRRPQRLWMTPSTVQNTAWLKQT